MVKIVPFRSEQVRERFLSEAKVSQLLSGYESIVTTYDTFEEGSCGCIVMESMQEDLLEAIPRLLTEKEMKKVFRQVVQAIAVCHDHGIAHMDIKPENVLLDNDGNAKLCDFGYACSFDAPPHAYETGTILYNAPEIRTDHSFDREAADVWSLGVLLYVLLTGNFPYPGDNLDEVLSNLHKKHFFFGDLEQQKRSKEACSLVKRILVLLPKARPSAHEILSDPWLAC